MNPSLFAANVLPSALNVADKFLSGFGFRDLVRLAGGHDFLLQASNSMSAEAAFSSFHVPFITGGVDAQAIAALRASGATFTSSLLRQIVEAPVTSANAAADILLLFAAKDVLFDTPDQCRARFRVTVALGSFHIVPKEPTLVHGLTPGEAVQEVGRIVTDATQAVLSAFKVQAPQPLAMRTLSETRSDRFDSAGALDAVSWIKLNEAERHIGLDGRNSFDVSAWIGGGLLEVAAPFAAKGDQPSASVRVAADVHQSVAHFTELTGDAALLLSDADPCGLVAATTQRIRQRSSIALLDDVSLVGGPATASVSQLGFFAVDAFPCATGACPLNVGATIIPGRVASRAVPAFVGSSRYGVVWSADAVKLLVRYCWDVYAFPRTFEQTSSVRLSIDGVVQDADAISVFKLDTLDDIELEYDSNGRRDALLTRGLARVVPQFIRLRDGRELVAKDPDDPVFAPSAPQAWAALGDLTQEMLSTPSPELLSFELRVTRGVTIRFGRPFTDPSDAAVVTDSRLSAPAQRIALLVA